VVDVVLDVVEEGRWVDSGPPTPYFRELDPTKSTKDDLPIVWASARLKLSLVYKGG